MSIEDRFYNLHDRPHPMSLDIVWCKFPTNENPKRPGPKARPGLVRSVQLTRDHKQAWVEVVYGTTRAQMGSHPFDLHIQKSSEIDKCSLLRATCFVLDRVATLPWSPEYFVVREDDGKGPIVGKLSQNRCIRLQELAELRRKQRP